MLARVLSGLGRTLIGIGLLLLLFVGFQLWGTGIHEARAQSSLDKEFTERLHALGGVSAPSVVTTTTSAVEQSAAPTTSAPDAPDGPPPTLVGLDGPDAAAALEVAPGDPLARIQIPAIGVDKIIVEGVTVEDLRKGPGHYRSTPQPGLPGNTGIAGHRTTYGAPFHDIDQLEPGDIILVTTYRGTWSYEVLPAPDDPALGHFIVSPEDVWVLGDYGDNRITLTACHPKYSAAQRIIVSARMIEMPAAPPAVEPTDPSPTEPTEPEVVAGGEEDPNDDNDAVVGFADADLDEGLGGDPTARTPAIVWGIVFALALAGTWQLALRWRRLPAYAVAAVPLAMVLFVWFENLDRWLPAR